MNIKELHGSKDVSRARQLELSVEACNRTGPEWTGPSLTGAARTRKLDTDIFSFHSLILVIRHMFCKTLHEGNVQHVQNLKRTEHVARHTWQRFQPVHVCH